MLQHSIKYTHILVVCLISLTHQLTFAQKPPKTNWQKQYEECAAELKKQQATSIDTAAICNSYTELINNLKKENAALKSELKEIKSEKKQPKLTEDELTALERLAEAKRELSHPSEVLELKEDSNQAAMTVSYMGNTYDIYTFNPKALNIDLLWQHKNENYDNFKNVAEILKKDDADLVFACNGGMYNSDQAPQGLFISHGKLKVPLDTSKSNPDKVNFYMQPNGVFYKTKEGNLFVLKTDDFTHILDKDPKSVIFATQSGPMLVTNNVINSNFSLGSTNKKIRNGVGISDDNQVFFVISNEEVNFFAFARLFQDHLKCPSALYLDGAISESYIPLLGRNKEGGGFGPIISVSKPIKK